MRMWMWGGKGGGGGGKITVVGVKVDGKHGTLPVPVDLRS